jgi:hypothetical protein
MFSGDTLYFCGEVRCSNAVDMLLIPTAFRSA